jgi:iron complex outermembrane receptor protein
MTFRSTLAAVACAISLSANAMADGPKNVEIPAGDLRPALLQWSKIFGVELIYQPSQLDHYHTAGVQGSYTPEAAVRLLLKDTPLQLRTDPSGAMMVVGPTDPRATAASALSQHGDNSQSRSGLQLAQAISRQNSGVASVAPTPSSQDELGTVIVTASRRAENQREVADSVTAFSGNELSQTGAQSFEDYLGRAPGVIFDQVTPGYSNVTIRGVGTTTFSPDQGQSTTGIYLNDIPLTDPGSAISIPDIDTFDLQRVEVLRGPQGTLFGTATLGGAVNYITNPVDLDTFEARLESAVNSTQNSSGVGYTIKEALNLPIVTDTLGIRITAIKRFDPGYVDNIGTGRMYANSHDVEDFRISALWKVNKQVSVSFLSFYDSTNNADLSWAYPALGDLKSDTAIPQYADFVTRINSLKVDANLDFATVTLEGAVSQKTQSAQADLSPYFGPNSFELLSAKTRTTSLEARLTSPSGGTFEWLIGVYHGASNEGYPGLAYQSGEFLEKISSYYVSHETSGFGEATYRFSDQWRATLGGRYYNIDLRTESIVGAPDVITAGRDVAVGFSPKASITFEPSSDFLTYALVSRGYRSGGVNLIPPLANFPTPANYGPDSLVNYEVGVRPSWFNQRLTLDSTLFFINWSDIQLRLARPDGHSYAANAGGAHNFGLENALNWTATPNLKFRLSATFLQAEVSKVTDLGGGLILQQGARIPGTPRWSASGLATYHWDAEYRPYVAVSARFVSGAQSGFVGTSSSLPIMNYSIFDLRAGFHVSQYDFSLYANNIANRRGVTAAYYAGPGAPGADPILDRVIYVQPRTVGLRIDWHL